MIEVHLASLISGFFFGIGSFSLAIWFYLMGYDEGARPPGTF